ncbi:MAG: hypothetical protein ACE5IJ_06140 [Thermoplasmata archaeon]
MPRGKYRIPKEEQILRELGVVFKHLAPDNRIENCGKQAGPIGG